MKNLRLISGIALLFIAYTVHAQIPIKVCQNGAAVSVNQSCPEEQGASKPLLTDNHGAIAVNKQLQWWTVSNSLYEESTIKKALMQKCGKDCQVVAYRFHTCAAVAYNPKNNQFYFGKDRLMRVMPISRVLDNRGKTRSNTQKNALAECEKKEGTKCQILVKGVCGLDK